MPKQELEHQQHCRARTRGERRRLAATFVLATLITMKITCTATRRSEQQMRVDPFAGMAQDRAEDRSECKSTRW